jgi:hypothetical protein
LHVEWALPSWGWPILLLAAVAAVLWTFRQYRSSEPEAPFLLRSGLIALRSFALVCLLLALAGPALYRIHSEQRPAEVVVVLEDSASMALEDGGGSRSRWERAVELAGTVNSSLSGRGETVRVSLVRGNGTEAQRPLTESGDPPLPPTAVGTDLLALIREVGSRWADRPLRGLVLLADGNETVRNLSPGNGGSAPSPFLAVGVGDPVGPPDRALQDLRYPDTAFAGDEVVANVSVASRRTGGLAHSPVTVRLTQGERLVAEATADETAVDGVTRLELIWRPSATGLQVYELEVTPLDNERYLSNNGTSLAVNVRKERAHLLLLAGRPGWDVRFLVQAAAQEERIQLQAVYRGREGLVLADSNTTWLAPADLAGWERWDGFVLAGWQGLPADFPWGSLVQAVSEGKGLLVLPGAGPAAPGLAGRTAFMRPPDAVANALPVSLDAARWRRPVSIRSWPV